MKEYKTIKGYENYSINNEGKVLRGNKEVKSFLLPTGYSRINLYKNGKAKQFSIHRLVATAFIGEPPTSKHVVNHKNSNRADNRVDNLEWVTVSENVKHGYWNGLVDKNKSKENLKKARLLANKARNKKIKLISPNGDIFVFESVNEASKNLNLSFKAIGAVARGKRNHHKGYKAEYI